jgi:hypothetical protein
MAITQDKWKQISLISTVLDNVQKHWREKGGGGEGEREKREREVEELKRECMYMYDSVCIWGGEGGLQMNVAYMYILILPSSSVVILMPQSSIPISTLTESSISKSALTHKSSFSSL